jgi:CHAD domain-containing protein
MSYRFSDHEPVGEAVPRVMSELIDESLEMLDEPESGNAATAVHETRKNCKKGRALARLVRPALGDQYRMTNRPLRDAARTLAPIRDPQAQLETFDELAASAGLMPDEDLPGLRDLLVTEAEQATAAIVESDDGRLEKTQALLTETRERAASWELGDACEPVERGLKKTYRRGRRGMSKSESEPEPHTFHEWRKRVKYLWYQVRLLRDAAPSVLRPLAGSLHDLSDMLGEAHDLVTLSAHLDDRENELDGVELETVKGLAEEKRHDLEQRALALGRGLYVEKPGAFATRIGGYWQAWR